MHKTHFFNYPTVRSISGNEFLKIARDRGATLHEDAEVIAVEKSDDGFTITTEEDEYSAKYAILTTGGNWISPRISVVCSPTRMSWT